MYGGPMHGAHQPLNPYLLASNNNGEYNVQRRYLQQVGWGTLIAVPMVGVAINMLLYGLDAFALVLILLLFCAVFWSAQIIINTAFRGLPKYGRTDVRQVWWAQAMWWGGFLLLCAVTSEPVNDWQAHGSDLKPWSELLLLWVIASAIACVGLVWSIISLALAIRRVDRQRMAAHRQNGVYLAQMQGGGPTRGGFH